MTAKLSPAVAPRPRLRPLLVLSLLPTPAQSVSQSVSYPKVIRSIMEVLTGHGEKAGYFKSNRKAVAVFKFHYDTIWFTFQKDCFEIYIGRD